MRRDILSKESSFFGDCSRPLVMPPERSIDIDTLFDFEISEVLYRKNRAEKEKEQDPCVVPM